MSEMFSPANASPPQEPARRSFLGLLSWLFIAVIGLATTFIGGVYALFPIFANRHKEALWQPLATLDQIPEGQSKYTINVAENTGWAESNTRQAVWVVRRNQSLNVFSGVCPHEGCTI